MDPPLLKIPTVATLSF